MINKNNALRVSIVIPVYNEEACLAACLEAIQSQSVAPYEVIVVDNNSSDSSRNIAQSFNFVKLISEPRQGVVHARSLGFNTARGEIIGRIDADTIIDSDWITSLQQIMADVNVAAVSGSVYYHDVIRPALSGQFDLFFRQRLASQLGTEVFLCGANMAVRRDVWQQVKQCLCYDAGIHEDFDLAIHIEMQNRQVIFDQTLHAGVSLRRFGTGIVDCWQYMRLSPRTYALHGRTSQRSMYPVIAVVLSTYWFIWLNWHAYDTKRERLSARRLLLTSNSRVNPATFVD